MSLADIDVVLTRLDDVVADMRRDRSRAGYFAAMYRKVTLAVREAVVAGRFTDGPRMARLDRVFAERYLDAWDQWRTGAEPTASWSGAFEASQRWRPIIVQHLLAGMNAHINLDLGIAAASVAPGADLPGLRGDFDTINDILGELVDGFMEDVEEVSPWIGFLDRIGGRTDQALVRFSIELARRQAWSMAEQLAVQDRADWGSLIAARDASTARLTKTILSPGPFLPAGLLLIRLRESNDVPRVIDLLGR
jgi:hypothetical protein